jgi:hypothetical protein
MKKRLCILLAALMLLSLTACGGGGSDDGPRTIVIGTWFDIYYVSKHTDVNDNRSVSNTETAQMMLDNMRRIEEEFNVKLDYRNLTFDGIQESITTSIMAGLPDCDVYMVDLQFGIPAVLSNLAISLESMGLEGTDVLSDAPVVMKSLNIGQDETYLFTAAPMDAEATKVYPLAFNMDMIRAKNLENPQDLYDRGEWTWDKWREYLVALTDTSQGIYGWSGYWSWALENLLFSNDTTIAGGPQTTVTDSRTIEVFDLFYTIYNVERTARPWDNTNWEINNEMYADGKSGFWVGAHWLFDEQGGAELPFEIGVVPWPVGPSGNRETNRHGPAGGNWYMIPKGVENPRLVFDVMYEWSKWYGDDLELAEDLDWARDMLMTERNFDYVVMMSQNTGFDIWNSLGLSSDFTLEHIMDGSQTAAQYAESVRPIIQDALDNYFK